jgi:multiple sugar transport system substrate-binding protein
LIDIYDKRTMETFIQAGILMDLTEKAEELGFGPDQTFESVRDAITYDGKQYRFPCNIASNNILYNKAIFDQYDVPYPEPGWTFQDLIEAGVALRERSGGDLIPLTDFSIIELLALYGADFFQAGGLYSAFDSEQAIAAMQMRHDLMFEHRVIPTASEAAATTSQGGWGGGGTQIWFYNEIAAMHSSGRWLIVQLRNPTYNFLGGKLAVADLPKPVGYPESKGILATRAAAVNVEGQADEAIKFLQYLASDDYSWRIVRDGDGMPPDPELSTPEILAQFEIPNPDVSREMREMLQSPEFHKPFVDSLQRARSFNTSPFIDSGLVTRWLDEARGYVDAETMEPRQAMLWVTKQVEDEIAKNLERRPDLQEKFEEVTGEPYREDWRERLPKGEYVPPPGYPGSTETP